MQPIRLDFDETRASATYIMCIGIHLSASLSVRVCWQLYVKVTARMLQTFICFVDIFHSNTRYRELHPALLSIRPLVQLEVFIIVQFMKYF